MGNMFSSVGEQKVWLIKRLYYFSWNIFSSLRLFSLFLQLSLPIGSLEAEDFRLVVSWGSYSKSRLPGQYRKKYVCVFFKHIFCFCWVFY